MVRSKIKIKNIKKKIDDSKIDFNVMNFEREFALVESKLKIAEKIVEKKGKIKLSDGGLETTFEFMLKKFPMEYDEVFLNIKVYDTDFFQRDVCDTLR